MSMIFNILRVSEAELDSYLKDSSRLEERLDSIEEGDASLVDIDQSWEGILFLLTGQNLEQLDHPLGKALFSNQQIDQQQDLGYGPAQYLTPDQVKELDKKLAAISAEDFRKGFDSDKMSEMGIHPNIWSQDYALDYVSEYFESVQEVFALASKNDEAIITFLN
ncbi:YfbM family protein [Terrimonas sp. NA20]|uniref:YfbM family protein n=1 Tax=Terrimonas ginsenosidimutans TaxID=2908004 RepID=A0ABS9KN73_9BACT|nr:YfbM family protein [Terrimonas ginsenosidimutans]MCG2613776.1 YfbM family protein [Terrimonas ginsenosidimutans]